MRKITHSLIVASVFLFLGTCSSNASAACNCKLHQKRSCDCSGYVRTPKRNCSCHHAAESSIPDSSQYSDPGDGSAPANPIDEVPVEENVVEDDGPVQQAIEATPTEAIPDAPPVEGANRAPKNPLPVTDEPVIPGEPTPAQGASQTGKPSGTQAQPASTSKDRIKEALRVKRPYSEPTLEKVPNPPVPDTTEVQLRELPVEFDSYGYIRSHESGVQPPTRSLYHQPSRRSSVVWSATGQLIK